MNLQLDDAFFDTNDYELTNRKIGNGSYGEVFIAIDNRDKKEYAAKIIKIQDGFNGYGQMSLLRESLIHYSLNHPAIIRFIGINFHSFDNSTEFSPTIITEYSPNGSLKDVLDKEKKCFADHDWDATKKYICLLGIADAMRYLHENEIIHRDLKPQNVLMDSDYHPHVCDFGLARVFANSNSMLMTKRIGTLLYMAPELFNFDDENYGYGIDVYAFAMLMYEIVTRKVPFSGEKKIMEKVVRGVRPNFTPDVPQKMKELIQLCWSQSPDLRPSFQYIFDALSSDFDSFTDESVDKQEINDYIDLLLESKNSSNKNKSATNKNEEGNDKLIKENQQLKEELEKLKTENQQQKTDLNKLKTENQQQKTDLNKLKTENQQQKTDLNKLKTENQQQKTDLNKLKTEKEQTIKQLQNDITKIKTENDQLKKENQRFSKEEKVETKPAIIPSVNTKSPIVPPVESKPKEVAISQKRNFDSIKRPETAKRPASTMLPSHSEKESMSISEFNSQTIKSQHTISAIISNSSKSKNKDFFQKVSNLIEYLLKFNNENDTNCFEILMNQEEPLFNIQDNTPIQIRYNSVDRLLSSRNFSQDTFYSLFNKFYYCFLELKYPSASFESHFNRVIKLKSMSNYIKMSVLISDVETDARFRGNKEIDSIRLDNNVKSMKFSSINGSFENCSLTRIIIPSSVTVIGPNTFTNTPLVEITIPNSVTEIGHSSFKNCASLKTITLSSSISTITKDLLRECTSLEQIKIPSNIKTIEDGSFYGCSKLTLVIIDLPSHLAKIGNFSFTKCSSLKSINAPASLCSIGRNVFEGCSSLTEFQIPPNVTSIESNLFKDCISLSKITIPSSVSKFGDKFLEGVVNLEILGNLTSIPNSFLHGNYSIQSLSFISCPITKVGDSAFKGCSELKQIKMPSSVTSLGKNSFELCSSLINISLPSGLKTIGAYSFSNCSSLKEIIIPSSVKIIEKSLFSLCSSLSRINLPNSITTISDRAFYDCTSLPFITLPSNLTLIGPESFYGCRSLTQIVIPSSVNSVGSNAFYSCYSLKQITVKKSLAFYLDDVGLCKHVEVIRTP